MVEGHESAAAFGVARGFGTQFETVGIAGRFGLIGFDGGLEALPQGVAPQA